MPKIIQPFLIGVIALSVGASAAVSGFAAPKPDAPDLPTVSTPVKVMIKPAKKKVAKAKTIVRIKHKVAVVTGLKGVVIDEPNTETGTISVVTENNEFATIATGMGTRITRGSAVAGLTNVHTGYVVRCQGAWDQDGFQYQATHVILGGTVQDTTVVGRVNAACENIARARKGGGFGKSLVAMIPPSSQPRGVVVGSPTIQGFHTNVSPEPSPSPAPPAAPPVQPAATPAPTTPAKAPGTTTGTPVPQAPIKIN